MNDRLISLPMEAHSLVNALRSADIPISSPCSKNEKSAGEVVKRRPGGHSRTQIHQDVRRL